ncbi:hypothetical protein [Novosphingobium sediminicola]|uniref:Uncharacterized protein n=1 Tax=Novosphingobium sediminicola TaxID=563162 RepID=A0A7W6CML8_9SPHN|nr:hypothetical protein [Novosphingobium sediminicola]MBB3956525.1 hypothetical protein [Novosphingobium sediminicola]
MLDIEPLLAFYKAKNGGGLPVLREGGKILRDFAGWGAQQTPRMDAAMTANREKALKTAIEAKKSVIRAIQPRPRRAG